MVHGGLPGEGGARSRPDWGERGERLSIPTPALPGSGGCGSSLRSPFRRPPRQQAGRLYWISRRIANGGRARARDRDQAQDRARDQARDQGAPALPEPVPDPDPEPGPVPSSLGWNFDAMALGRGTGLAQSRRAAERRRGTGTGTGEVTRTAEQASATAEDEAQDQEQEQAHGGKAAVPGSPGCASAHGRDSRGHGRHVRSWEFCRVGLDDVRGVRDALRDRLGRGVGSGLRSEIRSELRGGLAVADAVAFRGGIGRGRDTVRMHAHPGPSSLPPVPSSRAERTWS